MTHYAILSDNSDMMFIIWRMNGRHLQTTPKPNLSLARNYLHFINNVVEDDKKGFYKLLFSPESE